VPSIFIPPQPPDPRRLGFTPRRNVGHHNLRRRVINLKVAQGLAAASVPTAATVYPFLAAPVYLTDVDLFHLVLTATQAVSGSPAGVQIVVQMVDVNGNFAAMPGSPFTLTLIAGATLGQLATPLLVQNFGDLVAVGLQAASPWAAGQLVVGIKAKG
jgi:hypothetical protein